MDKYTYYLKALNSKMYIDAQWCISVLTITKEDESIKQDDYPFKLYRRDDAWYTRLPVDDYQHGIRKEGVPLSEEIMLTSNGLPTDPNKPLFDYREPITITNKDVINLKENETVTTVGRLLQNFILLIHPFGDKITYINKRFGPGDVESIVVKRAALETPPEGEERDPSKIYFDEYDTYMDGCIHLTNFSSVCVPALTYKALTPPPNAKEKLAELMEKYKDKLDDPVVMGIISKEMEENDRAYIKGDRSENFLISKKDFGIVRKRMFGFFGEAKGFSTDGRGSFISTPLCDGIEFDRLDEYNNDARIGSYSRGAETQIGGVAVKEQLRASSNLSIDEEDCGTLEGYEITLNESNFKSFIGFWVIENKATKLLTEDNIKAYLNKPIKIRFPSHCKTTGTGFCAKCCGPRLSLFPSGLSVAIADIGSTLLNLFMKAMHGKEQANAKLDIKRLIR